MTRTTFNATPNDLPSDDTNAGRNNPTETASERWAGRNPARSGLTLMAIAVLTLAACGNSAGPTTSATPPTASTMPTNTQTAAAPANPITAALSNLTGGQSVELTADTLPAPPDAFTAEEVEAFADRAIDIIKRGISPDVQTLNEDDAFDYVFANCACSRSGCPGVDG